MPNENEFPNLFDPLIREMFAERGQRAAAAGASPNSAADVYQLARQLTRWSTSTPIQKEFARCYARWLLKRHQGQTANV